MYIIVYVYYLYTVLSRAEEYKSLLQTQCIRVSTGMDLWSRKKVANLFSHCNFSARIVTFNHVDEVMINPINLYIMMRCFLTY